MIRVLDKHVADKIAAGEVIDRPVSVVKELVENSIDAGASAVTVEIKKGGKEYIRITDDGCGIPTNEAETALKRHATSKISEEKDLDSIATLGFRGEALASICAVSRLEMITRSEDEKTGTDLIVEGGTLISEKPTGCPTGTTITVRDLFYNIPARLKFMASDNAETRRITDMISRIALSYPDIRFRFISGGKDVFNTPGNGNILENILRIYGRDLKKDLIPVNLSRDRYHVRGFVSTPALSSSSRNRQFFCVNGRVVSSKTVERGLEKAYKQRLFIGRYPIAYLFISIPAEELDVNVHPTKKEIRFDDPIKIEDLIEEAVSISLLGGDSVPSVKPPEVTEVAKTTVPVEKPVKEKEDSSNNEVDINNLLSTLRQEVEEEQMSFAPEETGKNEDHTGEKLDIGSLDIIGIALDTYIITTDHESLYLIDQHAAHERVLFERFLDEHDKSDTITQTLIVPLQLTVSAETEVSESQWIDHVRNLGYDIDNFGDRVYIIREIPAFLNETDGEQFIRQFFVELDEDPDIGSFASLERIIMRSCKSAVKGGDILHMEESRALLDQLSRCDNPYSCPHGRPVLVKMTRYDLDKMFKRV